MPNDLLGEWTETMTITEFTHMACFRFRGNGWYIDGKVHVLVRDHNAQKEEVRVTVWNDGDPRPLIAAVLDLPVYQR